MLIRIEINQIVKYSFVMLVFSFSSNAQAFIHFTEDVYKSNSRCAYAGRILGIEAVDNSDEIGVYVNDGNGGKILIGAAVMGATVPGMYYTNIYGNDSTTEIKDGAFDNEILIFIFWDNSENREYTIESSNMSFESQKNLTQPSIPPTFSKQTTYGLLNLKVEKNNHPPIDDNETLYQMINLLLNMLK